MKNAINTATLRVSVMAMTFLSPAAALAQGSSVETVCANLTSLTIFGVFRCLFGLLGYFIAITFLLATFYFLWGVFKYIVNYENEGKRQESREFMMYGVIALFVMASVWGLVKILENTFGLGSGAGGAGTTLRQPTTGTSGGTSGGQTRTSTPGGGFYPTF